MPSRDEPVLGPGKPFALLAYLALTPGRRASREMLIDLLWADVDRNRARNVLRQSLFHLRRLLGDDALPGGEELSLVQPIESDRDEFLRAIERGDLDAAMNAYRGSFLDDLRAPGSAAFEQWADVERHRLESALVAAAELLVRRALNAARFRDAQRIAKRARDAAPGAESAWRLLLDASVESGDFIGAAVEANALEQRAANDQLPLELATRHAIARARQVRLPEPSAPESALVAELIGREREFSAITSAWDAVRAGAARHIHVSALAGLGKTRLLRDAVSRLGARGARIVEVRGTPGDRDIAFAFAGDLAFALSAVPGAMGIAPASASTLLALNPALSARWSGDQDAATGEEAFRRRVLAIADLLLAVADEQPIIVAIDDVHWIDSQSQRVLDGVIARTGAAAVLILTAARPERTVANANATLLTLRPLTVQQVASLVTTLGSLPANAPWAIDLADRLRHASDGSPLLLLETLRLALDEGTLVLSDEGWRCEEPSRLDSLLGAGEALRRRVRALDDSELWLLALLATVGAPLGDNGLAAAIGRTPQQIAPTLAALERHGLVVCAGDAWLAAHDAIADAARDVLDEARRAEAARVVGAVLVAHAQHDRSRLLRGIRQLANGNDDRAMAAPFRRFVRLSRLARDTRRIDALASEVLGLELGSPRVRSLAATIPLAWRLGLWNGRRQAVAAAAAMLLAGAAFTASRARDLRAATAQHLVYMDTEDRPHAMTPDAGMFTGRTDPLKLQRATAIATRDMYFEQVPPVLSPDERSVAWTRDSGDSTTLDIWLRTPAGTRRLTREPRDDKAFSWLPDGSALLGVTNRWSPRARGNYDIALFDTLTGSARQITSGLDHDAWPFASPDGTRIAFIREAVDGVIRVCVVPFDARSAPDCRTIAGHEITRLAGWSSLVELVLSVDSAGARPLVRYDWERDVSVPLIGKYTGTPQLSPDRKWVVVAARTDGISGLRDWVIPLDRPSSARRLEMPDAANDTRGWWEGAADRTLLIDHIEFTDTTSVVLPGVSTRFGIRALNAAGQEIPIHAPTRWHSSDTLVATVDSLGDVRARSSGTAVLEASLSGWRNVRMVITARVEPAITLAEERWPDDWTQRWVKFGDPQPVVTRGPQSVAAMWNRGDGTFPSMVVSRRGYDARHGLGVEVRLSTPLTRDDWQRARTALLPGIDVAALERADQRKAPPTPGRIDDGCSATFPARSGRAHGSSVAVQGGGAANIGLSPADRPPDSGPWWVLRLQIFPDGRCGVAVNGRAIWLSPEKIPLDAEFRLRLGDESQDTRILHGPLTIWSGVRTDVDWARVTPP